MKTRLAFLLGASILLWGACAPTFNVTMGKMPTLDPGTVIRSGMTTKSEMVGMFGDPDLTGVDEEGLVKWTWTHIGVEVKGGKDASITSFFNLEVSFREDKVSSFSYSRKAEK